MKPKSFFRPVPGSVCAPKGFHATGVTAGIKHESKPDMAMLLSETPCLAAGTFTTNTAKAAPVLLCIQYLKQSPAMRGIVVNSGNANAGTGAQGFRNAQATALHASEMANARGFATSAKQFFVCSTGRIGVQLPMAKIRHGISLAAKNLSKQGDDAAHAIMTTDTFAKKLAFEFKIDGKTVRLGGICKGAGMIQPAMSQTGARPALHATMLCFLTTDAAINRHVLQQCLNIAVAQSFNCVTVDGDTSTNDTVLLMANGQAGNHPLRKGSPGLKKFQTVLNHLTLGLAKMIARDGEGISHVVTLKIKGAASSDDAEKAIRAIGNSALVKCSWCGMDPNWGRILDAIGYSGAKLKESSLTITYNGIPFVEKGLEIEKNLYKVRQIVKKPTFGIECNLHLGKYEAILYTTDLTEEYVRLNKGE
ncbi:MAG: bifunctional glutamate N-acetyltransferase/amino-acid acetyltransferase ArgJ [Verrucomicrobiae bacterium]|nr:bifunctional glutamate N-acetyltransferase/amino-acid acetyltransferase ArgJ [Verrucomicrobiae bacterium]